MSIASEWNIQQKALKELIGKKDTFDKYNEYILLKNKMMIQYIVYKILL